MVTRSSMKNTVATALGWRPWPLPSSLRSEPGGIRLRSFSRSQRTTVYGDYDDACRNAASAQGLDPIMNRLRRAGIEFTLEQTGGWVMVVYVSLGNGFTVGLTQDGGCCLCLYDESYEWIEGATAYVASLDRVLEMLRDLMQGLPMYTFFKFAERVD
jgi:hypothetical protein